MSTPAPGRQRSLGASLLDQVLAETVDPAYAQAAAARAARTAVPTAEPAGRSPSAWVRRSRGQLLVALTLAIAGLLASVTYNEAAAGAQGRDQARQALRDDITDETSVTDDLVAQLQELTGEVTRTRQDALAASVVGQRALEQLAAAEQGAALVAVSGPGLRIELDNAPPTADSDPVGGSAEVAEGGIVQDGDLQLVVNALWASGAEAISINGQRVGATTAIRQAGEAILVDLRPVTTPYQVVAIGPGNLSEKFRDGAAGRFFRALNSKFGITYDVAEVSKVTLDGATEPNLRQARPSVPPSTAPTPSSKASKGG